jgi:two-component system response regulator YesN
LNKLNNKTKLSLRRFMISYLIILIPLIMIINVVFYLIIIPSYEDEIKDLNNMTLIHYSSLLNQQLTTSVEKIYAEIMLDEKNVGFMKHFIESPENDLWSLSNINNQLNLIVKANDDLLQSISIYYDQHQFINSSNGIKFLNHQNQNIYEYLWLDRLEASQKDVIFPSYEKINYISSSNLTAPVLTWIKKYPYVNDMKYNNGAFIFNIKQSFFSELINDTMNYYAQNSDIYIFDKHGNVLYRNQNDYEMAIPAIDLIKKYTNHNEQTLHLLEEDHAISMTTSRDREMYYVFSMQRDAFYYKSIHVKNQIMLYTILFLLAAFLIIYLVSTRIYKPIRKITNSVELIMSNFGIHSDSKSPTDDFNKIQHSITMLSDRVIKNFPIIKHNFYNELLENRYNPLSLEEKQDFLKIAKSMKFYQVSTIYLTMTKKDIEERETIRSTLIDYIGAIEDKDYGIYAMARGSSRIILIVNYNEPDLYHEKLDRIKQLIESVLSELSCSAFIASGRRCNDLKLLWQSYQDTRDLAPYFFIYQDQILEFEQLQPFKSVLDKELVNHQQWVGIINSQDIPGLDQFITKLIMEIRRQRISYDKVNELLLEILKITKNEILVNNPNMSIQFFDHVFAELKILESLDGFKNMMIDFLTHYWSYIQQERDEIYDDLMVRLLDYINHNLSDNFSLKDLSEKFHVSYSYLSTLFYKSTGKTFTYFVMEKRIELATSKLLESNDSIEQIARDVGISDAGYFIKQFKKYKGLTPKQYRLKNSM